MKKLNFLTVALISMLFFVSCGGNSNKEQDDEKDKHFEYPVGPIVQINSENKITGELSNYIKVTDMEYKLEFEQEYNYYNAIVQLKLKFTKSKNVGKDNRVGLNASILDENGVPLNEIKISSYDEKLVSLLKQGGNQEEWITFKSGTSDGIYFDDSLKIVNFFEKVKKATKITVTSEVYSVADNTTNSNSSSTDNSVSTDNSSSNENWDEILNNYEKFAKDYIDYTKKIVALQKKGDDASMTEVATLMPQAMQLNQDAAELGEKLQNAGSDLTSAQMTRYTKILTKFSQAALELSK